MELRLAQCCGSCKYSNKPKIPHDHAAYYEVARTERWCYKNGIPTMREASCVEWELEQKKGANPAFKRVLKQNERLRKFIEVKEFMVSNHIEKIDGRSYTYIVCNDKLCGSWHYSERPFVLSCKSNSYDDVFEKYEELKRLHN